MFKPAPAPVRKGTTTGKAAVKEMRAMEKEAREDKRKPPPKVM